MTVPNSDVQGSTIDPVETTDAPLASEPASAPWSQYLEPLPESVRPLVEPVFKTWDADVTKKFQSLHSEYDPYKELIDGYEPDALQQAVALVDRLNEDPKAFIQMITEAFGLEAEQGTANAQVAQEPVEDLDPYEDRFGKLETMLGKLAEIIVGEREQTQQQQDQKALDDLLSDLKTKHGEFDEFYVLSLMGQGMDPDKAVEQFKTSITSYASKLNEPQSQAPTVVSQNGGGYATEPINPKDLSDKDTKDLVVQMLAAAAAAKNG